MRRLISSLLPFLATFIIGLILFLWSHQCATQARGYTAYGGELMFLLAPVFHYVIRACVRDTRRVSNDERETDT